MTSSHCMPALRQVGEASVVGSIVGDMLLELGAAMLEGYALARNSSTRSARPVSGALRGHSSCAIPQPVRDREMRFRKREEGAHPLRLVGRP
jgi:hypothetical protein